MSSLAVSSIAFVSIFGGALLGLWLRRVLPEHHLSKETKEVMKLGIGLVGTTTALVWGCSSRRPKAPTTRSPRS